MRFQKYRDQCGLRPKAWFRRHTFLVPNLIEPNFDFGANLIQTAHLVSTLPNLTLLPHHIKLPFRLLPRTASDRNISRIFHRLSRTNYSFSRTKIYSINRHCLTRVWMGVGGGGYKCHLLVKILAILQLSLKF